MPINGTHTASFTPAQLLQSQVSHILSGEPQTVHLSNNVEMPPLVRHKSSLFHKQT